jgi:hypothetical protein
VIAAFVLSIEAAGQRCPHNSLQTKNCAGTVSGVISHVIYGICFCLVPCSWPAIVPVVVVGVCVSIHGTR